MSVQETNLKAIADAIREKDGTTGPIPASSFPERIRAIPEGGMPEDVFTISVKADPPEGGAVSGGGLVSKNMIDTITTVIAKPNEGFAFYEWQENGVLADDELSLTIQANANKKLVALFKEKSINRLPDGYTEVKWIKSNGASYIEIYKAPTSSSFITLECYVDFSKSNKSTYYSYGLIATNSYSSSSSPYFKSKFGLYWYNESLIRGVFQPLSESLVEEYYVDFVPPTEAKKMTIQIDFSKKSIAFDGIKKSASLGSYNVPNPINSINIFNGTVGKIYSLNISLSSSSSLNLVPCIEDSTQVAGMYDLVGNLFYKSKTSTPFVAGPSL